MRKIEYILWGVEIGQPDYMEEILYTSDKTIDVNNERVIEIFKDYDKLRLSKVDLSQKPNFINTIN
jgi:hypothetical protein|tara:strand:- start:282 stop:479 length:198 start_codon:yes stop_codon:yes gene_type:complete